TTVDADGLYDLPGMSALPAQTRAHINALSTKLRIPAGRPLMKQGNPGRQTFLITDGAAAVRRDGETIATRSRGEMVGEGAVLSHCSRNADVVAETDLTVLVMSPAELESLCDDREFRVWLDGQIGAHATTA
ncbi:MAG: cyclic nucleotide-binding domain-containing protein, partial [Mycobacteriales bacterium]